MKSFKKIVSCFLFIAILTSFLCVTPASAAEGVAGTVQNFTEWSVRLSENVANGFWRIIYGDSWREDELPDPEDAAAKYEEYVNGLQSDLGSTVLTNDGIRFIFESNSHYWTGTSGSLVDVSYGSVSSFFAECNQVNRELFLYTEPIKAPCAGTYSTGFIPSSSDITFFDIGKSASLITNKTVPAGGSIGPTLYSGSVKDEFYMTLPYYEGYFTGSVIVYADFVPAPTLDSLTNLTIDSSSRPSSIIGDYGIMGDDGSITKIEGNTLVNETDKSVYNPITTTQTKYTDCVFDYVDRSYNLTLEDGSTMKVVYGDENVTIHEGDTVYNVYYLSSDSGSGGSGSGDGSGSGGEVGDAVSGLLGGLGNILAGLIEGLLKMAAQAVEALGGLIDIFNGLVDMILGFFSGFTGFLGSMFPFLPEETFVILNFGLILLIAAAVIKKLFL